MASTPSEPTAKPENEEIIAYRRETICPSIIPRLPNAVADAGEFTHAFFELVAILIRKWLTGGQLVDSRVFPVLQNGRRHPFFVDERTLTFAP